MMPWPNQFSGAVAGCTPEISDMIQVAQSRWSGAAQFTDRQALFTSQNIHRLMGAHPYYYFVEYQPDIEAALQDLRQREFEAGRYNPAQPFLRFPLGPDSPAPGAKHGSIYEAIEDAAEDGTRSILDIESVSDWPDFGVASPLSEEDLERYFGTKQPTREMVSRKLDFLKSVKRGHCVYITVFKFGKPSDLFFGGYSFD